MTVRATHKALAVMALAAVVLAVIWDGFNQAVESGCGNEVIAEAISPDGGSKAIVFHRDCGATTGFSTQVSVIGARAALGDASGNVFVADTNHGDAPSGPGGGPVVKVQWQTSVLLVVSHHAGARVFVSEAKIGGVDIHYERLPN